MEDPRIEELMEFADSVDDKGEPTALAMIARRVESYLSVVDGLREELNENHQALGGLEEKASNLTKTLHERDSIRGSIQDAAQTAAMKASMATTTGQGAALRKDSEEKQRELRQFENDYAEDTRRYKTALRALDDTQRRLTELRDQISRRMNIVDALLQRAEIEWPSYFFDENERIKAQQKRASGQVSRRRSRRGGRRTIIRRRRAS